MRINKKKDRIEYCKWYLQNVKSPALSSEILSHILENKNLGNNISLNSTTLGLLMNARSDLFKWVESRPSGPRYWSLINSEELKSTLSK